MRKIFTLGRFFRMLSSNPPRPRGVDLKQKLVYGGDLPTPAPRKSFGRVLYDRLIQKERRGNVFQVNSESGEEQTTEQYLERTVAVAQRLKQEGVGKGDYVVLVGNNSLNMNTVLVGIFFLGAVPVTISHKTTLGDFKIMLKFIKPKYFGCDKKHLFSFKRALFSAYEYNPSKIFLLNEERDPTEPSIESFEDFIRGMHIPLESFQPADVENPAEDLALVTKALTDGAPGRAVGITHMNLNSVVARFDAKDINEPVILMVQKVMWMSGIYSLIISCCFGSKLIVMSEFDEEAFLRAVHEYKVTTAFLYSSKIWQLYKHDAVGSYDLSSCKNFYGVDGFLPKSLSEGMREKTGLVIKSCYGIIEMTGFILETTDALKEGSSGKPVYEIYGKVISDTSLVSVGPNERGQICFKGPTLTKGYINDPKSTRQMLDKEGFLLSGHYGYYDDDGDFFIIDKIHYVIKYKGHKVSPRQLEGIIKSMDSIKDVAVAGIRHPTDGYYPIAFVVVQKGYKVTSEEIMKYVNENVEDHKRLRGGVVFVSKIPRSRDNGTIKRGIIKKVLAKFIVKSEATAQPKPETRKSSKG